MKKQKSEINKTKEYLILGKNKEDYELMDIRTNKPIYFHKNPLNKEGQPASGSFVAQEVDEIQFSTRVHGRRNKIGYFSPNSVGILLSISNKSLMTAKSLYDAKINPDKVNHLDLEDDTDKLNKITDKSKIIYDYIELIQTSIVFGYTALEAFVNLSIPDGYEHSEKNSKGIIELSDKEAIERWLSLKDKLNNILVTIYKTKPLKHSQLWTRYTQFEDQRNDIIHQKSVNHTNFYKKYFKNEIFQLCKTPEEIIKFFFNERTIKNETNPLWPWIINAKNDFPARVFDSNDFEITGNIYEGKFEDK